MTGEERSRFGLTTISGEWFSIEDEVRLVYLVWRRFGRDADALEAAWMRLFQAHADKGLLMDMVRHAVAIHDRELKDRNLLTQLSERVNQIFSNKDTEDA